MESRGYTKNLTAGFLVNTIEGSVSDNGLIAVFNTLSFHRPYASNNHLAVTTIQCKCTKHTTGIHVLSREVVRDTGYAEVKSYWLG